MDNRKPEAPVPLASASGSPTPAKSLTELQQAKIIKGMGARVYLRGLEVIVVAGDMEALKVAWSRLVPDLDIIESRCQPAIVIAANDLLENAAVSHAGLTAHK
jgi:hypothetical protein